jgi:hypothetical protein
MQLILIETNSYMTNLLEIKNLKNNYDIISNNLMDVSNSCANYINYYDQLNMSLDNVNCHTAYNMKLT